MQELTRGVFPTAMTDPFADEATQPFWDAALEGRLVAPRCTNCGTFVLPPAAAVLQVQGRDVRVRRVARHRDHLLVHGGPPPAVAPPAGDRPLRVGSGGPRRHPGRGARLIANFIDVDPETVAIGDRVEIWFDRVSDTLAVPRFRPL